MKAAANGANLLRSSGVGEGRFPEEEPGMIHGPFLQHKVTNSEASVCVKRTSAFSPESGTP